MPRVVERGEVRGEKTVFEGKGGILDERSKTPSRYEKNAELIVNAATTIYGKRTISQTNN